MRAWLRERKGEPADPLFPTRTGTALSRDALEHRLAKHVAAAAQKCPSLNGKRVTAHVLRHTAAMRLLHAGVDTSVIALWLGHEQVETTQIYLHSDPALKGQALARTKPPDATGHLTRSSRSSKPSNYADLYVLITAPRTRSRLKVGITRTSAYNHRRRHLGIDRLSPATVHHGQAQKAHDERAVVLKAASAARPKRFINWPPIPPALPGAAWIHKPTAIASDSQEAAH